MYFRMIRGALARQWRKMALIAFTIALGASLATAMLNVMLDVGDKVNRELKTYGANIVVKPKDSSLLTSIYDVEDSGSQLQQSWLREDELGKLKTIFWAYNIVDFSPFLPVTVTLPSGESAQLIGTWFNHHLDLPTGESLDAGVVGMRGWWDVVDGDWIDEQGDSAQSGVMVGATLAERLQIVPGDTLTLTGPAQSLTLSVTGIFDAGGDEDEQLYCTLDLAQSLSDSEGRVASIEVSALTTPDNELAVRAAQNPNALSAADYETWYCTAYVSAICYQITEVLTNATASAVRQVADSEGAILEKTQLLMILITALSLIGAALGISNLVTASVMERAQEIGLLKALGAHDGPIIRLVMTEILLTALLGGAAGYFLGFGFAQLIGRSVFGAAIAMNGQTVPLVAALIVLVTAAGSMPAILQVLRLRPAEVLHGNKV